MAIDVRVEAVDGRGALRAYDGDEVLGSTVWVRSGDDVVIVQHTGVEPAARGRGVGRALFEALVDWARSSGTRLSVSCPYMIRQFHAHPGAKDVLR